MDVRLEGVVARRGGRTVLRVPALVLRGDRTTALLGPNGAGKSTLLRLVAGLEGPAEGRVAFDGLVAGTPEARAAVAFAFQQAVFVSGTVEANLELALRLRGVPRGERSGRAREAAAACGIEGLLGRRASSLSGGEAQRANLARALALRAPLTLLDEPLAGLDGPARRQLLAELPGLLRRFARTTVVVTHDPEEALRLADDLVVLEGGRVLAGGETRQVLTRPPNLETAAFLGFDILQMDGGTVAVAPGTLVVGGEGVRFELEVDGVRDLGSRVEVEGRAGEARVAALLPAGMPWPEPGSRVGAGAPEGAILRFGMLRPGGEIAH